MSPKPHDFQVTLVRNSPQIPWGIRVVGGTDLNAPLIVTRVGFYEVLLLIVSKQKNDSVKK